SEEIVIELVADPPGYIWSFPRPSHLAIGICAEADAGVTAAELRAKLSQWMRAHAVAPHAHLEPYAWPIPSLSSDDFKDLTLSGPGWFLVGDAAGLVDPITREGIYFALLSGEWAAEAAAGSRGSARYKEQIQDDIAADLVRAARYKARFFEPRFRGLLLAAMRNSGKVR